MASTDRAYTLLLSHLHNTSTKLPIATIQGALAHHLATLSPLPTPLAGTAISSPFYLSQPFTHAKLQSFATAFRHATHLKYRALVKAEKERSKVSVLLGRSMAGVMGQWVKDVLRGVYGGHPVLRIAACSGLLLGVEDLKVGDKDGNLNIGSWRSAVEDETVVALAEVMDTYAGSSPSLNGVEEWEKEFQPAGQGKILLVLLSFPNMRSRYSFVGVNTCISIITSGVRTEIESITVAHLCSIAHIDNIIHVQGRNIPVACFCLCNSLFYPSGSYISASIDTRIYSAVLKNIEA